MPTPIRHRRITRRNAPPSRDLRPLRPGRALVFALLAVAGLWVGAQLAHLEKTRNLPLPDRSAPSVAWQDGGVVVSRPEVGED